VIEAAILPRLADLPQALEAGGHVRKGEKGVTVVYADRFTPQAEKARAQESGEDARSVPFLKRFTVFNVAQCEGLGEGAGKDLFGDPAPCLSVRSCLG
jgi:antirestriction protein ArdC